MKLSELVANAQAALEKYGDREVIAKVDAQQFTVCYTLVSSAEMRLSDEDYTEDPELLDEMYHGAFCLDI